MQFSEKHLIRLMLHFLGICLDAPTGEVSIHMLGTPTMVSGNIF